MGGIDVAQQGFLFCKLLVTVGTEDRLQLQVDRAQVTIQVSCVFREWMKV